VRRSVLHKVPRRILSLTAISLALVFLVSVFAAQGDYDGVYSLSSENQKDDQGCDVRGPCSVISTGTFADIPETRFLSGYLLEREVGPQVSVLSVSSHLNRAPPLFFSSTRNLTTTKTN
jgi:hypothetical protein